MKNQYFGDKRDYFKYGLLEALATGVEDIQQLTCIWMLTPPVANNDGKKVFVPHPEFDRLTSFFQACQAKAIADVAEMKVYFRGQPYRFFSYGDSAARYLTSPSRSDYFRGIPAAALDDSIVFFDPDNGLEPARGATTAHLRYEELADVFNRMNGASIGVIYQHLPRIKASRFWPSVASTLRNRLAASVAYIAEGDLAFFVIPREPSRLRLSLAVLNRQAHAVAPGKPSRHVGHINA